MNKWNDNLFRNIFDKSNENVIIRLQEMLNVEVVLAVIL
jgi:hypothetical protein